MILSQIKRGCRVGFFGLGISNDSLLRQIDDTFASSYIALLLLASLGFFLVFLAMRITYLPLHQLTRKLVSGFSSNQGYFVSSENLLFGTVIFIHSPSYIFCVAVAST